LLSEERLDAQTDSKLENCDESFTPSIQKIREEKVKYIREIFSKRR
jgi:hypothetical protein